MGNICTPTF